MCERAIQTRQELLTAPTIDWLLEHLLELQSMDDELTGGSDGDRLRGRRSMRFSGVRLLCPLRDPLRAIGD